MSEKTTKWARHQPKDGDLILVCGHGGDIPFHWFALAVDEKGQIHARPDGTRFEAKWACICNDCFIKDPNPEAHTRDEKIWIGDDPVIRL